MRKKTNLEKKKINDLKDYLRGKIFFSELREYGFSDIPKNYQIILRIDNLKIYGSFVKDKGGKFIKVVRILKYFDDLFRIDPEYLTKEQFSQTEYKIYTQTKINFPNE